MRGLRAEVVVATLPREFLVSVGLAVLLQLVILTALLGMPPVSWTAVTASNAGQISVPTAFHVAGGSSGSGLFDTAGRIVGVLSAGDHWAESVRRRRSATPHPVDSQRDRSGSAATGHPRRDGRVRPLRQHVRDRPERTRQDRIRARRRVAVRAAREVRRGKSRRARLVQKLSVRASRSRRLERWYGG